jgi:hypothetical protein
LSKEAMKDEVIHGAELIADCWPEQRDHYIKLIKFVNKK